MNISSLGIPNIRTTKVGSRRERVEIVEAVVRLEAWDGYLVKRWENGRAIADGTIVLDFSCTSVSTPQDSDTQGPAVGLRRKGREMCSDSAAGIIELL
jgi:hypothetical protein